MEKKTNSLWNWFKGSKNEEKQDADRYSASIEMEKQIGEQIYNALQGSVVEEVLNKTKVSNSDAYWRSTMEGHSLKVEKELLSDFYELCNDVKLKLGFDEKVDFYITGDSSVNAFSVAAESEDEPHIVNINSALFGLMSNVVPSSAGKLFTCSISVLPHLSTEGMKRLTYSSSSPA